MTGSVILAVFISFILSAAACPLGIPFLHRLKFGQQVREDGPQAHLKKSGTPTMGGIMIVGAAVIASLIFIGKYPKMLPALLVTLGFGVVGFLDDYLKVVRHNTDGLKPAQKMLLQLIITLLFCAYMMLTPGMGTDIIIPFTHGKTIDLGWLYIPFALFVILGTDNGVNFSDGLDGLCSSITVLVATFFAVVGIGTGSDLGILSGAVAGALMGFLLFNVYPAKVFMGDTGSLALGGFVASTALMMKMPLFILIVGLLYCIEIISVILQVAYFKKTGGKRLFKMAPIHHHFELMGWSETRVVAVFSVITALLCLIGYVAL